MRSLSLTFALWILFACAGPGNDAAPGSMPVVQYGPSAVAAVEERASSASEQMLEAARVARQAGEHERARLLVAEAIEAALAGGSGSVEERVLEHWGEMGTFAHTTGELASARRVREELATALARTLPEEHPHLQLARLNLAATIADLGDLQGARALGEQVLAVFTRTLPDEHHDLQTARLNLAVTIKALGDLQGARALEEQVLAVFTRTLPEDHAHLQLARLNLAATIADLGDIQGARTLEEQVLAAFARTLPEEHPDLQTARLNLAVTTKALGDLRGARALEEQVLAVFTRTLPEDHPHLQLARLNLAATIKALGDLQGARALEEQVLAVRTRTLPEEHPDLQVARLNLAGTIKALGDLSVARALQEQVLAVFTRTLPDDHPDLQIARSNLAGTIAAMGDLPVARALEEQVLAIFTQTLPDEHPALQLARTNLAATIFSLGDLPVARALEEQVLAVEMRTLPEEHAHLQMARQSLAWTVAAAAAAPVPSAGGAGDVQREGARRTCTQLLLAAASGRSAAFLRALTSTSPREAEEAAQSGLDTLDQLLTFALGFGALGSMAELEPAAFSLSETTRGAAVRAAAWQRGAAGSQEYEAARARVQAATDELARLAQSGGERDAFHAARVAGEEAWRELAALAREISGGADPTRVVTVGEVAGVLGRDDAVVAYRRFVRSRVQVAASHADPASDPDLASDARPTYERTESLCAFVLRPPEGASAPALTLVDLGPLEPITRAVDAWRDIMGASTGRGIARVADAADGTGPAPSGGSGVELRRLLLDPLAHALGDARRVVVLHDDVTNLVPLDALPDGAQGLLGDRVRIEVRGTLVELLDARAWREGSWIALALGDACFDRQPVEYGAAGVDELATVEAEPARVADVLRGTAWEGGFTPLAHTGPEARGVAELWKRVVASEDGAIVLAGVEASRASLVAAAPRARWLHVATHGWHAPESVKSFADVTREQGEGASSLRASSDAVVKGLSPMLLCGLALAGANLPEDAVGRAPGLLTAEEMGALDLSSCELAVLSACDTNVGVRRAGQGVASFQRALQMAGARSVITSLWKVPDEATRELMLDFYRRIWLEKQPKWQALWEAKMALRNEKDERGNPKYAPRDWAAWVLTGAPE